MIAQGASRPMANGLSSLEVIPQADWEPIEPQMGWGYVTHCNMQSIRVGDISRINVFNSESLQMVTTMTTGEWEIDLSMSIYLFESRQL